MASKTQPVGSDLTLFSEDDLVSRATLDRIPNNAEAFDVPVSPLTVRILKKKRKGFGAELLDAATSRLSDSRQLVEQLPRAWFERAAAYLGPGTKNKGGMQSDLTRIWPDFRAFYVKIRKERDQA